MRDMKNNLLLQFSLLGLLAVGTLLVGLGVLFHQEFGHHFELLALLADGLRSGALQASDPAAFDGLREHLLVLRVRTYLLVGAGLVILYLSLSWIAFQGWRAIHRQQFRFRTVVEGLGEGLLVLDRKDTILFANRRMKILLGENGKAMIGRTVHDYGLSAKRLRQGPGPLEVKFRRPDGTSVWAEVRTTPFQQPDGAVVGTICAVADITERKRAEKALKATHLELERNVAELEQAHLSLQEANDRLNHDAFHDALTGLPNRALFQDRLQHALERYQRRSGNLFAVLFLDFDRFKVINDTLGHHVGDRLLVEIGKQLRNCLREGDTVARFGGDEFTILLEEIAHLDDAIEVAERVLEACTHPFVIDQREIHISASIGIVSGDFGYAGADEMLRDADLAMYRAKSLGKARYEVFDRDMRERAIVLLELETDLRRAVEENQLEVYYQPIVSLGSGQLSGFEALVRWRHPKHGLIQPNEFIPVAEETRLILEIDRWVLREVCRQGQQWQEMFPNRRLTLSVNLSGLQFGQPDLAQRIEAILEETGFDPRLLRLEVTETNLIQRMDVAEANLARLRRLGIQLYIDDFGTGYSSLSYLHQLPADTLKIDRSFIERLLKSPESAELVRAIITMARSLGVQVVAEGVETDLQMDELARIGCHYGQGFFFSKPVGVARASAMISGQEPLRRPLESDRQPG